MEYSIKSIQSTDNGAKVPYQYSSSTATPYRIPFLSRLIGQVRTDSGVGVNNVTIRLLIFSVGNFLEEIVWRNFFSAKKFLCVRERGVEYLTPGGIFPLLFFICCF